MPHFVPEVTFGNIVTIIAFIASCIVVYTKATAWLSIRFTRFEETLDRHSAQLDRHAERMSLYEERYIMIAENLQRIIGRLEGMDDSPWPRNRRRNDK